MMSNVDIKRRNSALLNGIMGEITGPDSLIIPIGQLVVFFHAINGLGIQWGDSDDHERRNYAYFKMINPRLDETLIQAIVCGSFKPEKFIHPFEEYYTTSGDEDIHVLPAFFRTVDALVHSDFYEGKIDEQYQLLAFIYLYFLVIHPFIDGNGRVARNLLDYYNQKLNLNIGDVWNNEKGENGRRKFSDESFHKDSFIKLFEQAGISSHAYRDKHSHQEVASLIIGKAADLKKLSLYIISDLNAIKSDKEFSEAVKMMAGSIKNMQESG